MKLLTIKKETRILGIDSCNHNATIGAIVRGGLYLDGVLNFGKNMNSLDLGYQIRESRYYPELRFIMVHQQSREKFDADTISRTTKLPIIEIAKRKPAGDRNREWTRMVRDGETVYARSKLDQAAIVRLLRLSWTDRTFPEPVRVAHLISLAKRQYSSEQIGR